MNMRVWLVSIGCFASAPLYAVDCVAVATDSSGIYVARSDGTAVVQAPAFQRPNASVVALSPDRKKLAVIFSDDAGSVYLIGEGGRIFNLRVPDGETLGYAMIAMRWESDALLRITRKGHVDQEFQFLSVIGWPNAPELRNAAPPAIGSDCRPVSGSGPMLCVSGSSIWANGVEVLQYSRPYPRSIPTARKYPAVTVNRGSTALAVANPPINVSVADDGGVDGQIKARVENQAFGYAEAYLHTGDFISVDVDDRRFRLVLSGLTAAAALFTPFEAGSSAGFLRFEHIAVLGTVRTGILLYAVADDDGSQRLGVGARFNPDATLQWLSGAPDVALPRISGTLGIRGLRDGLNVQIDDHVGTYLLPIDYRITSYSGYFAASGIWVPAVQYTSLSAAAATYLQGTLKGRGSPGSVAVARQWQCQ